MKEMFSVYDSKAAVFSNPFTSVNKFTALRDFQAAAIDPNSTISTYPSDFILYQLGTFDEHTGAISPIILVNLGPADQFIN
ncbi:MAG: nonstructural protein [Microvirus sp.]|nr:MAG: nonstructural protein [Microvirus sp.]